MERTTSDRSGSDAETVAGRRDDEAGAPKFLILHALRIKGTCDAATVAGFTGLGEDQAGRLLDEGVAEGFVQVREGRRGGFRLTEAGRSLHGERLSAETGYESVRSALEGAYEGFLPLNHRLKEVCSQWQIRNGQPNDHTDAAYDDNVVASLAEINTSIRAVLVAAAGCDRLLTYMSRFDTALTRIQAGELAAFARPMAHSYHDAWMELHQDLLLSLGRERDEADGH